MDMPMTTNQKPRIVIFTGGRLGAWALDGLLPDDVLVGADRGALFLIQNGYAPDLALGDFDSVTEEERERIRAASLRYNDCDPVWKDRTDTEMAVNWALSQSPSGVLLLGALGSRFDHSLANVQLLKRAADAGIPCRLKDEHNELALLRGPGEMKLAKDRYDYVSLLPLSGEAAGITLEGFQYPLRNATLTIGQSLGVSNVLTAATGTISLREGDLLVIRSRD